MKGLIVMMAFCCLISYSCDNKIDAEDPGPVPQAGFIYQVQSNTPGRVSFASTSTGHNELAWDFGNGSFAYNQDAVTRTYTRSGKYYVKLTAINVAGVSTFEDSVEVELPPVLTANFSLSFNDSQPLTVFIQDNSQNGESYQWNFGDGNNSTRRDITSHTYEASGTYTITLRTSRGEEDSPNFRVTFTLIDPTDLHDGSSKTWKFKTMSDSPVYFVERAGQFAFSYSLLPCELNDRYTFNSDRIFINNNQEDARVIQQGGECRQVDVPPTVSYNFIRTGNSNIALSTPGSYIGDIDSGPIYRIRSISANEMLLTFDRVNPFNTAQNETVVMVLVPEE